MGRYRARDLLLVPSLISFTRLPLAIAFVYALRSPPIALIVLVAAAGTDILDGWYARRHDQVTATGAVVDGVTDKLFAFTVVGSLLFAGHLTWFEMLLLGTRDIGEIPLVIWLALSRRRRRAKEVTPSANPWGKIATAIQFIAIGVALMLPAARLLPIVIAAVAGGLAAASYWRRATPETRPR